MLAYNHLQSLTFSSQYTQQELFVFASNTRSSFLLSFEREKNINALNTEITGIDGICLNRIVDK